jgi:ligand-binding sensor protein
MKLNELLALEEWQAFEKELFDRFFLNCTVYNAEGISETGKPNWCNPLCPEIKSRKASLAAICAAGNQYFMAEAQKTGKAVIDVCDAGLLKIAVPIFVGDEFLGTAGGCGRLPEDGEIDTFIVHKTTELAEEAVAELCTGLKTMTAAQAKEVAGFIEARLQDIVQRVPASSTTVSA